MQHNLPRTTRQEAIDLGFKSYFTGKPCKHGHIRVRQTYNGVCRGCNEVQLVKWHLNNPGRATLIKKEWEALHPGSMAARQHTRRASRRGNGGTYTPDDINELYRLQRGKCGYCRTKLKGANQHIDHIIPLFRGGSNGRSNLQLLCRSCNTSKGAKDPIDYAKHIGLLL